MKDVKTENVMYQLVQTVAKTRNRCSDEDRITVSLVFDAVCFFFSHWLSIQHSVSLLTTNSNGFSDVNVKSSMCQHVMHTAKVPISLPQLKYLSGNVLMVFISRLYRSKVILFVQQMPKTCEQQGRNPHFFFCTNKIFSWLLILICLDRLQKFISLVTD